MFEIVISSFECFNDSKSLAIMGLILSYIYDHFSEKEGHQMALAQAIDIS